MLDPNSVLLCVVERMLILINIKGDVIDHLRGPSKDPMILHMMMRGLLL